MTNYNWCHNPDCHTIETQSRIRGSGENKVLRTVKIKVRENFADYRWWQGWDNHFCKYTCFFEYVKIHWQEIVNIAPVRQPSETPIKVVKTKSQEYRHQWSNGQTTKVPYTSVSTTIEKIS